MRYMQSPMMPAYLFPPGFNGAGGQASDKKQSTGTGSDGSEGAEKPQRADGAGAEGEIKEGKDGRARTGSGGAFVGMTAEEAPDLSVEVIPPLIVVAYQIPIFSPGNPLWGKGAEDGEGFCFVMYFMLTREGREQLVAQKSPASQLLKRFVAGTMISNCATASSAFLRL